MGNRVFIPPYRPKRLYPQQRRRKIRARLMQQNPRCFYCQSPVDWDGATLDHVLPKAKGGTDAIENLVLACRKCNQAKGSEV